MSSWKRYAYSRAAGSVNFSRRGELPWRRPAPGPTSRWSKYSIKERNGNGYVSAAFGSGRRNNLNVPTTSLSHPNRDSGSPGAERETFVAASRPDFISRNQRSSLVRPESRRNDHSDGKSGFATSISDHFWTLAGREMSITAAKKWFAT